MKREETATFYCRTYFELKRAIKKAHERYEDSIQRSIPFEDMVEYTLIHFALLTDEKQVEAATKTAPILELMRQSEKPIKFENLRDGPETSSVVDPINGVLQEDGTAAREDLTECNDRPVRKPDDPPVRKGKRR